jgi:hypothetical protein
MYSDPHLANNLVLSTKNCCAESNICLCSQDCFFSGLATKFVFDMKIIKLFMCVNFEVIKLLLFF